MAAVAKTTTSNGLITETKQSIQANNDNMLWLSEKLSRGNFSVMVDGKPIDFNRKIYTELKRTYRLYLNRVFKNLAAALKRRGGIRGFKLLSGPAHSALATLVSQLRDLSPSTIQALRAPVVSSTLLQKAIWLYYYAITGTKWVRPASDTTNSKVPGAFFVARPGDIFSMMGVQPVNGVHPSFNVNKLISAMGTSLKDDKTGPALTNALASMGQTRESFVSLQEKAVAEIDGLISACKEQEKKDRPVRRTPVSSSGNSTSPSSIERKALREAQRQTAHATLTA